MTYLTTVWTKNHIFFKGLSDEINRQGGTSDFAIFSKYVVKLPYDADPANFGCVISSMDSINICPNPQNVTSCYSLGINSGNGSSG